jgi:hypothetical protein
MLTAGDPDFISHHVAWGSGTKVLGHVRWMTGLSSNNGGSAILTLWGRGSDPLYAQCNAKTSERQLQSLAKNTQGDGWPFAK